MRTGYEALSRCDFASNNIAEHVKASCRAAFYINDEEIFVDEVVIEYDNVYCFPSALGPGANSFAGFQGNYDISNGNRGIEWYCFEGTGREPGIGPFPADPASLPDIPFSAIDYPTSNVYTYGTNLAAQIERAWSRYPMSGEKIWYSPYFIGLHKVDLRTGFYAYERAAFRSVMSFPDCFETQPIGTFELNDISTGFGNSLPSAVNTQANLVYEGQDMVLLYGRADVTAEGRFLSGFAYANEVLVDESYEVPVENAAADDVLYRQTDPSVTDPSSKTYYHTVALENVTCGRATVFPFPTARYTDNTAKYLQPHRGAERLFAPMHFNYIHFSRHTNDPALASEAEPGDWQFQNEELVFPPIETWFGGNYDIWLEAAQRQLVIPPYERTAKYIDFSTQELALADNSYIGDFMPLTAELIRNFVYFSNDLRYSTSTIPYPLMHPGWDTFQLPIFGDYARATDAQVFPYQNLGLYGAFGATDIAYTAILRGDQVAHCYSMQYPIALAPMLETAELGFLHEPSLIEAADPEVGYVFPTVV